MCKIVANLYYAKTGKNCMHALKKIQMYHNPDSTQIT